MDFGFNLDDDLFENIKSKPKKHVETYAVKICEAGWFTQDAGGFNDEDLSLAKFQADASYHRGSFEESRSLYKRCLDHAKNSTVRRDCSEAIARSSIKLGILNEALHYANLLFQESTNLNQKSIASNLLALVYHISEKHTEELRCLQTCLSENQWNADLWLRLAICYANIDKIPIPTTCGTNPEMNCGASVTNTVCPEAHRFDGQCVCCSCSCHARRLNKSPEWSRVARIYACAFRCKWLFLSCRNGHRSFAEKRNIQARVQLSKFLDEMKMSSAFQEKVQIHMVDDSENSDSSNLEDSSEMKQVILESTGFEKKWFVWIGDIVE